MARYSALIFLFIIGAFALIYFGIGKPEIRTLQRQEIKKTHAYQNPNESIEKINLRLIYFIPKDKKPFTDSSWREALKKSTEELLAFHKVQLGDSSNLTVSIDESPTIGESESRQYDTNDTNRGNPHALTSIINELEERRIILPEKTGSYDVTYIVYEGVGAAGAKKAALLSRIFMSDDAYASIRSTLFSHEFYHTLGLFDRYDDNNISASEDIMGLGRFKPLSTNYLEPQTIRAFSL